MFFIFIKIIVSLSVYGDAIQNVYNT